MRHRTLLAVTAVLGLCLAAAPGAPRATGAGDMQDHSNVKVAIASPANIFNSMQETKDLKQKLEQDFTNLNKEAEARKTKVKDQQAARDLLKVDSPQYQQADQELLKMAIEFDTWFKIQQATLQGNQKQQMKLLFDKIVAATSQVASSKGIDVVVADQRPDLPENLGNITVEQLRVLINQRNILFMNAKVDISNEVVAALDAKYKAGGGTAAAPAGGTAPVK